MAGRPPRRSSGTRLFESLARGIVRHPWYPIAFWAVLLLVAAPFFGMVSSVTTNSATTLSSSAPSSVAQAEMARLFPGTSSSASASYLLLTGPGLLGPVGQAAVANLSERIASDPRLTDLGGVLTLDTTYASYLGGQVLLAAGVLGSAEGGPTPALPAVNATAQLVWGVPATYLANWQTLVAQHPGTPPADWNLPALNATRTQLGGNSTALLVLSAFYEGPNGTGGFNGSFACAASPPTVVSCAEAATRSGVAPLVPQLAPTPAERVVPTAVLADLGLANFTTFAALRNATAIVLSNASGASAGWLESVWSTFGTTPPSIPAVQRYADTVVASRLPADWPLPIPAAVLSPFVDPSGDAELVYVTFTEPSSYTSAGGTDPIYGDVVEINRILPEAMAVADPGHTLTYYQTGPAALDQVESADLDQSLAIVLPLTVVVLIGITMAYFRSPIAPLLTFGGLGIALGLSTVGVVLLGTLVQHVDSTALTLQDTFILGVGTDYSIFLVARYREELHAGARPDEAVVTSVTWAGQSIATSGATAILATLALAFSGVALLSQWGMVLSLGVLITVLVSLTIVPAFLALLGPRVFWPATGRRFERQASQVRARVRAERTYFYRVGRATQRRPGLVVGVVLLASLPLLYVALNVPISYDFYAQVPGGRSATDGLSVLGDHFGQGFAFPITVLVTFEGPLLTAVNTTNTTEFADLAQLTGYAAAAPDVASVDSPFGPSGAPLSTWLDLPRLAPVPRTELLGALAGYVGTDGRTVALTVYPVSSGLSLTSVNLLDHLRGNLSAYASTHPDVTGLAYGGGASITHDLQSQTQAATERMVLLVAIGLVLVLLAVLRSYLIPLMAVATIGLSIGWAWGITSLVLGGIFQIPIFFFVPTVLFILILGLGIDYNIFLLTRVREERLRGRPSSDAAVEAVARTGGIISAAAVILAAAFAILLTGNFILLRAIGFAVATAIVLDAMVVRTYLVPASLHLLGDRVWARLGRAGRPGGPPGGGKA